MVASGSGNLPVIYRGKLGRSSFWPHLGRNIARIDPMKRLPMRDQGRRAAVGKSDQMLRRNRVAAGTGQIIIRQRVEPFLAAAHDLKVFRNVERKGEVVRIAPIVAAADEREFRRIQLVSEFNAVDAVIERNTVVGNDDVSRSITSSVISLPFLTVIFGAIG